MMYEAVQAHSGDAVLTTGTRANLPGKSFYEAPSRRRLIDEIVGDVTAGRVVSTVEGEAGIGKTALVAQLAARLQTQRWLVIPLAAPSCSPVMVQQLIGQAAGVTDAGYLGPSALFQTLQVRLVGKGIVLIVDDADRLSAATCQYFSLLISLFEYSKTQLSLVFFGALGKRWRGLDHPSLESLRQHTAVLRVIRPLEHDEAVAYVDHKLRLAGQPLQRPLRRAVVADLVEQADGLPAELDAATERVLLHADGARVRGIVGPAVAALASLVVLAGGATLAWRSLGPAAPAAMPRLAAVVVPPAAPGVAGAEPPAEMAAAAPAVPAPRISVAALSPPAVPDTVDMPVAPAPAVPAPPAPAVIPMTEPIGQPMPAVAASPNSFAVAMARQPAVTPPAPVAVAPVGRVPETTEPLPDEPETAPARPMRRPPGLVLVAQAGDTMQSLYARLYRGANAPSFENFVAANQGPIKPGALVVFPELSEQGVPP